MVETGSNAVFTDRVAVLIQADAVVGHHVCGGAGLAVQFQRGLEGQQLGVEVVSGVDVELAVVVVRFTAGFSGAVAGEVLDRGVQGLAAPAQVFAVLVEGGLQAVHVRLGHIHRQLRVFGEGTGDTAPAGFGRQVDLGAVHGGDTHSAVFSGPGLTDFFRDAGIEGSSDGEGFRPGGADLHAHAAACFRVKVHRNRQGQGLDIGLDRVGAIHSAVNGGGIAVIGAGAVFQALLPGVGQILAAAAFGGKQHQRRQLLSGNLLGQVSRTLVRFKTPVFIGIQLAVPVVVLEGIAINFNNLQAAVRAVAQGGAAFVNNLDPSFLGGLGGVLCAFREGRQGQCAQHHGETKYQADHPFLGHRVTSSIFIRDAPSRSSDRTLSFFLFL